MLEPGRHYLLECNFQKPGRAIGVLQLKGRTFFREYLLPEYGGSLAFGAGGMLAFARSLGEFGATIMVAGNIEGQTRTIPLAIFTLANQPGGMAQSWRLVGLSILLAAGALAVSEWLERTRTAHVAT